VSIATRIAIIGSGNIGTDLMMKIGRSQILEMGAMVGIDSAYEVDVRELLMESDRRCLVGGQEDMIDIALGLVAGSEAQPA
jgi:acetaldehyde dehydrogenase (acetylating)